MCNPRRVIIKLHQAVREEWSRTVEAHVAEQTEIEASMMLETQIDLAAELGEVALQELRTLLAEGYGGWQADASAYRLELNHGISLRYHPDTGRLQVAAQLHETVEAAASASNLASGMIEGTVEAKGSGRYYDDGWGGYTESKARYTAEEQAREQLAEAEARLRTEQQQQALNAAQQQAEAEARRAAQQRLHEETARRQAQLDEAVEQLLRESEEDVQAAIGSLLGQTYRRALIRLVQQGGGQVLQDEQQGAVIELIARI
ncbi:MAG: hypothetical protein HC837_19725 [Chloroflexaceae bacterium]|nr:hypothetical protein [Chloroflexaceae bacterium]